MSECKLSCEGLNIGDNKYDVLIAGLQKEIDELCETATAKFLFYDGKVAELCTYIKTNLTNQLQCLLADMKFSGELDDIVTDIVLNTIRTLEEDNVKIHQEIKDVENKLEVKTAGIVTPQMFGAIGDGVNDDSEGIQKTINSVIDGGIVEFPITEKLYVLKTPIFFSGKNIIIRNGRFNCDGLTSVFNINDDCNFIIFENCYFYRGNQIIRIFNADNITIKNCVFEETGYCIIQSHGSSSNNVNVLNNRCINIYKDFVECNCANTAPSYNWVITGNTYLHKEIPTVKGTEQRFVGITSVKNVVISNNIVEHVKGDSCVHLEDTGGKVIIEGNIFKDSMGFGYIFIMHESHDTIINGNHFINTLNYNADTRFIYVWNGENARGDVIISNNMFDGCNQSYPFTCGYNTVFNGNRFKGFDVFLPKTCKDIKFLNNYIECNKFCYIDKGVMNAMVQNASFKNNIITGDIHLLHNNTGTQFTRDVVFDGNEILGDVSIKDCKNLFFTNNTIKNDKTLTFNSESFYGENMVATNNYVFGSGLVNE